MTFVNNKAILTIYSRTHFCISPIICVYRHQYRNKDFLRRKWKFKHGAAFWNNIEKTGPIFNKHTARLSIQNPVYPVYFFKNRVPTRTFRTLDQVFTHTVLWSLWPNRSIHSKVVWWAHWVDRWWKLDNLMKNDQLLYKITLFISTGVVQAQGNNNQSFSTTDFPILKILVNTICNSNDDTDSETEFKKFKRHTNLKTIMKKQNVVLGVLKIPIPPSIPEL